MKSETRAATECRPSRRAHRAAGRLRRTTRRRRAGSGACPFSCPWRRAQPGACWGSLSGRGVATRLPDERARRPEASEGVRRTEPIGECVRASGAAQRQATKAFI